jgi:hypothetical protein
MNLQISTGSNELDNFYKKEFNFSYSSINKLLFSPRMFYNHYVLKEKEDSTDSHLVIGRVLHCLLLEPLNFDNQFAVMTSKIPSENNKKIIDNIFKNYLVNQNNTLTLEDYSKDILTHLLTINLHQSLKTDQQRLDKILTDENNEYFEFLKLSLGKTVIDEIILDNCKKSLDVIKANNDVRALLQLDKIQEDDKIEVYNELIVSMSDKNLPFGFKGVLDNVVVDYNSKTLFINDLKTSGKSIQDFPESVDYYKYWIQGIIYVMLASEKFLKDKQDWNVQLTFIVIDKYNQVYPYQVSSESLNKWKIDFEKIVTQIRWHYDNKEYNLPYDLALGNVKL